MRYQRYVVQRNEAESTGAWQRFSLRQILALTVHKVHKSNFYTMIILIIVFKVAQM